MSPAPWQAQEHPCQVLTGSFPGTWWRPDHPDSRVAGVLTLDYDGISLELIGSFGTVEDMGRVRAYEFLHGVTTGGLLVTLMGCHVTNETLIMSAIGLRSTRLQPGAALIGDHVNDPQGASWRTCRIELERMTAWASPLGFERSLELTDSGHLKGASFRYEIPQSVVSRLPGATLSIRPRATTSGDLIHETRIAVEVEASFELDQPANLEEINQEFLKPLLNLVILATQKPTSIVKFCVAAAAGPPNRLVEVVMRRPAPASEDPRRLHSKNALFLLPDLLEASANGVALWYAAAAEVQRAFDLVFAVRNTPRLFLDHRFLNAATAAESYHEARFDRHTMPKKVWDTIVKAALGAAGTTELADQIQGRMAMLNKPSLRDRIEELIKRGGEPLRGLLPDPDGLASRAARLRNDLAHGSSATARNLELFDATDELLLVLEFHFLREAGFSAEGAADRLKAASSSYSGLWLRRGEASRVRTPAENPGPEEISSEGSSTE